jgi:hypothetical protein
MFAALKTLLKYLVNADEVAAKERFGIQPQAGKNLALKVAFATEW